MKPNHISKQRLKLQGLVAAVDAAYDSLQAEGLDKFRYPEFNYPSFSDTLADWLWEDTVADDCSDNPWGPDCSTPEIPYDLLDDNIEPWTSKPSANNYSAEQHEQFEIAQANYEQEYAAQHEIYARERAGVLAKHTESYFNKFQAKVQLAIRRLGLDATHQNIYLKAVKEYYTDKLNTEIAEQAADTNHWELLNTKRHEVQAIKRKLLCIDKEAYVARHIEKFEAQYPITETHMLSFFLLVATGFLIAASFQAALPLFALSTLVPIVGSALAAGLSIVAGNYLKHAAAHSCEQAGAAEHAKLASSGELVNLTTKLNVAEQEVARLDPEQRQAVINKRQQLVVKSRQCITVLELIRSNSSLESYTATLANLGGSQPVAPQNAANRHFTKIFADDPTAEFSEALQEKFLENDF